MNDRGSPPPLSVAELIRRSGRHAARAGGSTRVEDALRSDRGAHAAALDRLGGGLREAVTSALVIATQVEEPITAERDRLARRNRNRVRGAVSNPKASLRLATRRSSDELAGV